MNHRSDTALESINTISQRLFQPYFLSALLRNGFCEHVLKNLQLWMFHNIPRELDELMFEGILPKSLLDVRQFRVPSALDCPSCTGKHVYKVRLGKSKIKPSFLVPVLAVGIFSVCCSQRKSCMRQSFRSPAKKRALPSPSLSTCVMKEGSLGPRMKEGEKASFLAGFHFTSLWSR